MTYIRNLFLSMSFKEIISWAMLGVLAGVSAIYLGEFVSLLKGTDLTVSFTPINGMFLIAICLIILSIAVLIPIAVIFRDRVDGGADERDREIRLFSGFVSAVIMAVGIMLALGSYLYRQNGDELFHSCVMSLLVSQLAYYFVSAVHYRAISGPLIAQGEA